jgi:hypothetical protein
MKNIQQILLFILLIPTISYAQIVEKDSVTMLSIPQDKAYLSFDKPFYTAGETMYFKAFLANATDHKPDTFATVLYVDFMELATNRMIVQQKLKIERGTASGSFYTEGSLGTVFVHAYTRWMGNISPDFHFNKTIEIFEPKDAAALAIERKEGKKKIILPAVKLDVPEVNNDSIRRSKSGVNTSKLSVKSLQFFPEGGNLLEDFANRIAFKATDNSGKGVPIKAVIKNGKDEEIVQIQDNFLGMGRFNLVVKKGEKYTAFVKNEDGSTTAFPLPNGVTNKATMIVENVSDNADIKVVFYFNYDSLTMPNAFNIIAHQRGKLCFNQSIAVKNKRTLRIFKMTIPRAVFKEEGISTITLMEESGKPIAERLTFIRNKKRQLNIQVTTNKTVFDKREKVTVSIETKTTDGTPIAADLSFAVTNETKIGTPQYNEDFRAYLMLRSDLRGHIEQPNYYFEDTTAQTRLALDNLLMTQGWRRFNWSDKRDSVRFKYEPGLSVEAVIRRKKAPVVDAQLIVFLTRSDNRTQSAFTQTDEKGRLILENLDFQDSAQLYFNVANSSKTYTVEQELSKGVPSVSAPKIYVSDQPSVNLNTYLDATQAVLLGQKLRTEKEIMLQEFEVKARKKDEFENDSRLNSTFTDRSYVIDDNEQGSVITYLQSKFIKAERTQNGDVELRHSRGINGGNYGLVIDGFGQGDGYILNSLFMNDIQRIDIFNTGDGGYVVTQPVSADGTPMRTDGVVHILTKSGDPNYRKKYGRNLNSDIPMLNLAGYNTQKQFYTPDYAVKKPEYAEADRRTTLYWSPIIRTAATGKAIVSFYTSDDAQIAKILVEGIDGTGKIGVAKSVFKVQ